MKYTFTFQYTNTQTRRAVVCVEADNFLEASDLANAAKDARLEYALVSDVTSPIQFSFTGQGESSDKGFRKVTYIGNPNAELRDRATISGKPPELLEGPAPAPVKENGQHADYWVLPEAQRKDGFVRPIRRTYVHGKCGVATTMSTPLAETYAKNPNYYGSTFCCGCSQHYPVDQFVWNDGSVVGS